MIRTASAEPNRTVWAHLAPRLLQQGGAEGHRSHHHNTGSLTICTVSTTSSVANASREQWRGLWPSEHTCQQLPRQWRTRREVHPSRATTQPQPQAAVVLVPRHLRVYPQQPNCSCHPRGHGAPPRAARDTTERRSCHLQRPTANGSGGVCASSCSRLMAMFASRFADPNKVEGIDPALYPARAHALARRMARRTPEIPRPTSMSQRSRSK